MNVLLFASRIRPNCRGSAFLLRGIRPVGLNRLASALPKTKLSTPFILPFPSAFPSLHASSSSSKLAAVTARLASRRALSSPLQFSTLLKSIPLSLSRAQPSIVSKVSQLRSSHLPARRSLHRVFRRAFMGQSFGGGHGQDYTIHILIALNVIVFGMWQLSERDVAKRNWMVKNFTASARNVLEGRVHTLLTSGFSQASTGHLLVNVLMLWVMGRGLLSSIGRARVLALYLGAALSSTVAHIAYQNLYMPPRVVYYQNRFTKVPNDTPCLGASGACTAMAVAFAAMNPHTTFLVYFVIPMPAWLLVTGLVAYDGYYAFLSGRPSSTSHVGHLGGAAFGLLYYLMWLRRGGRGGGGGGGSWRRYLPQLGDNKSLSSSSSWRGGYRRRR